MNEKLLHYIWQFQLFNKTNLQTIEHQDLKIVHPGNHNENQGPDFLNAKIKVEETIWAGSVEIHINSSDWRLHRHSEDENYNNVVLHVVWNHDQNLQLPFPTLVLQSLVPKVLLEKYMTLMSNSIFIPCEKNINSINNIVIEKWKERILMERLQEKTIYIESLLKKSNSNWDEVCWWMLARNFGGKINGDQFEQMAQSLPFKILLKHKDSLLQIESMIFGQAGLLKKDFIDAYPKELQKEFSFLKKKYNFKQPKISVHFLRMRPANFPTIRLAQLSHYLHLHGKIISKIIEEKDIKMISNSFKVVTSDYWNQHYLFDEPSVIKVKKTGQQTINNFLINSVVVLLYAYGYYNNIEQLKTKAINWLEKIPAEENVISNEFVNLGLINKSAYDSQALIHLKNRYCNNKKCLECAIGNAIFKKESLLELQPVISC